MVELNNHCSLIVDSSFELSTGKAEQALQIKWFLLTKFLRSLTVYMNIINFYETALFCQAID